MTYLVEEYFLEVDKLFAEGNFSEGKKVLEELFVIDPTYGRAHNHLGWLQFVKFNDFTLAEYHFKLAIKYASDYPAGYLNYIYLLNEVNNAEKLLQIVTQAMKVEGINKAILFNELGRSCELNGLFADAKSNYTNALKRTLDKNEEKAISENLARVISKLAVEKSKKKRFSLRNKIAKIIR